MEGNIEESIFVWISLDYSDMHAKDGEKFPDGRDQETL